MKKPRRGIFRHFSDWLIQIETVDEFLSGRRQLGDIRLEKGFVFFSDRSWCLIEPELTLGLCLPPLGPD